MPAARAIRSYAHRALFTGRYPLLSLLRAAGRGKQTNWSYKKLKVDLVNRFSIDLVSIYTYFC